MTVTIDDIFGREPVEDPGVGIEIEVEGDTLPIPKSSPFWKHTLDQSLRGGVEYISDGPLPCSEIKTKALNILYKHMKPEANKDQSRCSTHVHVSVGHLSVIQLYTVLTGCILLDSLLMKHCGEDRHENLFCQPVVFTEGLVVMLQAEAKALERDVSSLFRNFFTHVRSDRYKYSSLNIASIKKLGTLEFRGMRFLSKASEVDEWSTQLYHMVNALATEWKTPEEFILWYQSHTVTELFYKLFSSVRFIRKLCGVPDYGKLIAQNTSMACDLGLDINWNKVSKNLQSINEKDKNRIPREDALIRRFNVEIDEVPIQEVPIQIDV